MKKIIMLVLLIFIVVVFLVAEIPKFRDYCRIVTNGTIYRLQERSLTAVESDTTWTFIRGRYTTLNDARTARQQYIEALAIYWEENFTEWEKVE